MPTACAAMPMRPPSSARMATLNPSPSAPEAVRRGHPAPLEDELGRVRGAEPELVLHLGDEESRRALLDQERGDAVMRLRGVRLREDQGHRRLPAVRDEHLAPVEHVVVAVAAGQRRQVPWRPSRPGARSGRSSRAPRPEARGPRKRSCCAGVPELQERLAHERVVDRHHHGVGGAGDRDLLEGQHVGQRVGAAAARASPGP